MIHGAGIDKPGLGIKRHLHLRRFEATMLLIRGRESSDTLATGGCGMASGRGGSLVGHEGVSAEWFSLCSLY